ncbi:M81 family metallopeptidase (plasmid) [Rhizobium sp. CB3060]|uniref:M81 family metallopeptidase n=1 Tax=Rhizobium sp. CB3060 TaxID=3138255 RepID=UPI0021A28C29|nr:M81 family metallopeptidase [Rhizobium tropici]UWU25418.1 M81 family metallopeptidase [Rhizobium tropici]
MSLTVFAASIVHESHTFSITPTTLDDYRHSQYLEGEAIDGAMRGTRTEWGAVLDLADEFGWHLVAPLAASAVPAGKVTDQAFDHMMGIITRALERAMPVHGVLLPLHGAMVTESHDDAEGEILRQVRAIVGPAVPIAVSLDLHANATEDMARLANIITTYRTTPHTDMYETAERAGRLLQRAMQGEIKPSVTLANRPVLSGLDHGRTTAQNGAFVEMLALVRKAEAQTPGVLDIGVNAGFDFADVPFTGPTVLVTGDGARPEFREVAERLADFIWDSRGRETVRLLPMDEVISIANKAAPSDSGPLLIGDYTDNPDGGAYGDGTNLVRALLAAGIKGVAVGAIADPEAAAAGLKAGVGATVTVDLGGKTDPRFGGTPIRLTGTVGAVSDGIYVHKGKMATGTKANMGPSFRLDLEGMQIIVTSYPTPIVDREQFRIYDIEPERMNILACKAMNHFRADFEPIARGLIYVDAGGICSLDFKKFHWRKLRRPIWPLDLS